MAKRNETQSMSDSDKFLINLNAELGMLLSPIKEVNNKLKSFDKLTDETIKKLKEHRRTIEAYLLAIISFYRDIMADQMNIDLLTFNGFSCESILEDLAKDLISKEDLQRLEKLCDDPTKKAIKRDYCIGVETNNLFEMKRICENYYELIKKIDEEYSELVRKCGVTHHAMSGEFKYVIFLKALFNGGRCNSLGPRISKADPNIKTMLETIIDSGIGDR